MEIKEFARKVQRAVADRLGKEHDVRLKEVQKNNGVLLQGLLILTEHQNVSPTIYMNPFLEAYEEGVPFAEIVDRILYIYEKETPGENVDISFFREFDAVRDRICYKLISKEQNMDLLTEVPYVEYLDLAVCFYYAYQGESLGMGSILIYNTHLEMWKTSVQKLWEIAQINTQRLFPWECSSMESVIREMLEEQKEQGKELILEEEEQEEFFGEMPMQILSNTKRVFGAACILYPGLLEQLAAEESHNLYLIPSSIHEMILLPDYGAEEPDSLREMIVEVNSTQVEPEEVLSNRLYYYDRMTGQVTIVS